MINNLSDLRLSKDMKYTALYWAMRFFEKDLDIFEKKYNNNLNLTIFAQTQKVFLNEKFAFHLNSHQSFVKLEWLNRVLKLGYSINEIDCQNDIAKFKDWRVQFITWDEHFNLKNEIENHTIFYKSRLVSGVLEFQSKIKINNEWFDYGLFEKKIRNPIFLKRTLTVNNDADFVIEENRLIKYLGKSKIVKIVEGIEELESSLFWDNQLVEEIILPESLKNLGGDTFYNCKNLKKITITKNVEIMGNNPFAGCPLIDIQNESPYFKFIENTLYSCDMETIIYHSIKSNQSNFFIPKSIKIIGKHAFYLCDSLEKVTLPKSLEKMENNPFSGCSKLSLINNSFAYYIKDDVIYNKFKTSVVGVLNKIKNEKLELINGIKTINRNSFWNCKGIEKIVLPESLEDIGYNPFVGCSNIKFENYSAQFNVIDGVLYNKDLSKIICFPAWKAKGKINLIDSVIQLERGAFSGCNEMTEIKLHNVNLINKNCFSNCLKLKKIYISDFVKYIGEWAFSYCKNLKFISIFRKTIIDNNVFSNCTTKIHIRNDFSNNLIESENIYTLKSMQENYKNEIDAIIIDPPYNSNIDYIGYKDGDYENYQNFIENRINLSRELLSNKGFLVINIDEGESKNLIDICKNIFGNDFVSLHKWKKQNKFFDVNRVILNKNKIQCDFEYIILCSKKESELKKLKQPYMENEILKEKWSSFPSIFDFFGTTSSAKDEIEKIFGKRDYFSTPKPLKLMKEIIRSTTSSNSLILDFFAGSGTLGQACDELNKEDNGNRKFILISNNESDICRNVTKKRLEKANIDFEFIE